MSDLGTAAVIDWRASQVKDFTRSELFARTFAEGMDLVEEAAAYLDGGGRHDAGAREGARERARRCAIVSWEPTLSLSRATLEAPARSGQDGFDLAL